MPFSWKNGPKIIGTSIGLAAIGGAIAGAILSKNPKLSKSGGADSRPSEFNALQLSNNISETSDIINKLELADEFMNFADLELNDYCKIYGYEFCMSIDGRVIRFALPIAPSNVSISVPAAVNITTTLGGVVEENNGSPLRSISISGTTGVYSSGYIPNAPKSGLAKLGEFIFRDTIKSFGKIESSIKKASKFASATLGGEKVEPQSPVNAPTKLDSQLDDFNTTGYAKFHNLARFFDFYLAVKKTSIGKKTRLQFLMHKDQMYYDVIFNGFSFVKSAGTLEYQYSINLTAYGRSKEPLSTRPKPTSINTTQADTINTFSAALATIRAARDAVAATKKMFVSVGTDFNRAILEPINEGILLYKEFSGIGDAVESLYDNIVGIGAAIRQLFKNASEEETEIFLQNVVDEGITTREEARGWLSGNISDESTALNRLFNDPYSYPKTLSRPITNFNIPPYIQERIDAEKERIRNLTIEELEVKRKNLADTLTQQTEYLGGSSATYNRINRLPQPKPTNLKRLTIEDIETLSAFNDILMGFDKVIATKKQASNTTTNDYATFYADFARASDIQFQDAQSKFFVPFEYGSSLEKMALVYLGDANRWMEIAAINGLKAPYIDEVGYFIPVIGTGSNNTVTIRDPERLYINQVVELSSDTKKPTRFKIKTIDKVSQVQTLIRFEPKGDYSVSDYLPIDNAKIKAYLPDTVNSNKLIGIPTATPIANDNKIKITPKEGDLPNIAEIARVDLMLTSDGDIVFGAGDVLLSSGMANLTQAAKLKIMTNRGRLLQDPNWGNPVESGGSIADVNAQDVLKSLNEMFIQDDRFTGVLAGKVNVKGVSVSIDILVGVAGSELLLPISTELPL